MISTARKVPLLRYGLIVSLIILLCSTFYSYLYYSRSIKSKYIDVNASLTHTNPAKIDSCLSYLNSADKNSQLYLLTSEDKYFKEFKTQIGFVNTVVNSLNGKNKGLKVISDSLVWSASAINIIVERKRNEPVVVPVIRQVTTHIKIDTVKSVVKNEPIKKRKLFGRIMDAFSSKRSIEQLNKEKEGRILPVLVKKRMDTVIVTTVMVPKIKSVYTKNYSGLLSANAALKDQEQVTLFANKRLIAKLSDSLKKYKTDQQSNLTREKMRLNNSHAEVAFRFHKVSIIIFLFVSVLVFIILFNIWKIFRNQKDLIVFGNHAEKYALSKSAFLATMSHEIRTPLNSVIGFSEQLSQGELNESQQEQVSAISSSSKMLLDVVNEILDFSKFETGKMNFDIQAFNPYTEIEDIFKSVIIQAEAKGIKLFKELAIDKNICLNGDSFRLKQVILNFLSNAIKFTEQGTVTLTATMSNKGPDQRILHVAVKDSGIGISKENIPLIFGEFSQIAAAQKKTSQKGTGLGLAISKKIIELQNGTIKVSSEYGKGSEFSFQLPFQQLDKEQCAKNNVVTTDAAYQQLKDKHVLIAEDNQLSVLLLTTILKKRGITYDIAYNGKDALALFEANTYDMLLTDIEMPEMDGLELSNSVRSYKEDTKTIIPILALTANVMKEDKDKYLEAGMNGVVLKPFSEKNLLDNMASVLK